MPEEDHRWVRVADPAPGITIQLRVEIRNGRPICTGARLEAADSLTAAAITRQPWKSLIEEARTDALGNARNPELPIQLPDEVRRTEGRWPPQFYDWVVFIHKVALRNAPQRPIQWITENVRVPKKGSYANPSKATVHRWIEHAEKAGHYAFWDAIQSRAQE
jgi:hypothetical protein